MALPFTPFPIFAPYEHWKPASSYSVPQNHDVRSRLDQVDPACKAFTSVMYCSKFLECSALEWAPDQAKARYSLTCHCLELMLNWSFFKGIPLMGWDVGDFREFLNFQCNPPTAWCSSISHLRYLPNDRMEFADWAINERWRIFRRKAEVFHKESGDDRFGKLVQWALGRSAKVAKVFFDFYLAETGLLKANCAEECPRDILGSLAKVKPSLCFTSIELDWAFQQLMMGNLSDQRSEQILLYMAIARHTIVAISDVHMLGQFRSASDGSWVFESGVHSRRALNLSVEFNAYLERYLGWYQVDASEALPSAPMFPTKNGAFSYSPDALNQYMTIFGERLSVMARTDSDPAIVNAAAKFKGLNFSSIRRSSDFR
ncbi:hypothetical protein [Pseudomonas sp. VEM90]